MIPIENLFLSKRLSVRVLLFHEKLRCGFLAKLLLSGYYGFGNLGDEAILASTVEAIGRRAPGVDISVLSANPSETSVSHGIKAFNRMSPGGVVSAIRASDLVVFGGGSLLQDATSFRSLSYYIAFIYLTKVLGKPLVVYANGIGPLRSALGKRLTRAALLTAREITLRDPESESVLRQLGVGIDAKVTVTADPAFLLTPAPPTRTREILASHGLDQERDIVWLALRGGQEDGFYRAVAEAVTLLRSEGFCPALLVMQERDVPVSEAVERSISSQGERPVPLVKGIRPAEALGLLEKGVFCFGMRLHTLILSAHAGVPFLGVDIDPKIGAFCRMVGNPALPDPRTGSSWDVAGDFRRFLNGRTGYEAELGKSVPALRAKAAENIDMILRVLYSSV